MPKTEVTANNVKQKISEMQIKGFTKEWWIKTCPDGVDGAKVEKAFAPLKSIANEGGHLSPNMMDKSAAFIQAMDNLLTSIRKILKDTKDKKSPIAKLCDAYISTIAARVTAAQGAQNAQPEADDLQALVKEHVEPIARAKVHCDKVIKGFKPVLENSKKALQQAFQAVRDQPDKPTADSLKILQVALQEAKATAKGRLKVEQAYNQIKAATKLGPMPDKVKNVAELTVEKLNKSLQVLEYWLSDDHPHANLIKATEKKYIELQQKAGMKVEEKFKEEEFELDDHDDPYYLEEEDDTPDSEELRAVKNVLKVESEKILEIYKKTYSLSEDVKKTFKQVRALMGKEFPAKKKVDLVNLLVQQTRTDLGNINKLQKEIDERDIEEVSQNWDVNDKFVTAKTVEVIKNTDQLKEMFQKAVKVHTATTSDLSKLSDDPEIKTERVTPQYSDEL
ncbi:MAG: hypothetical protein AAF557_03050 [Pseudomonadota bacterium]